MDTENMSKQTRPRAGQTRRAVVTGALAGGLATLGLVGTAPFGRARAAAGHGQAVADIGKYPKNAFSQKKEPDAIKALYGKTAQKSDKVSLNAPEIAENGAVVPISVTTTLPDVTSISIVIAKNPFPLAASYAIPAGSAAMVANRLKMAKTSEVIALVESGGKLFSASKQVKVTVGGCGG